ncbi:ATP-binding protein [Tumidithrix elongata RA019]|uniref:histidine kinase n=1 Tax=Tumidithrix elongata BACA0141 TaxID=2716417 RepID=A0AAW9PYS4_9CYAN|nr:ATP-binding protein [Tumidithrix elongata RA019]
MTDFEQYQDCLRAKAQLEQKLAAQQAALQAEISDRLALEQSFLQIGTALESASDAVCISDTKGMAIYVNKAFSDLFGYSLAELKSSELPPTLFANPLIAEAILKTVIAGGSWSDEIEMCNRMGHVISVSLRADAIKDYSGTVIGAVGIYTNISDRVVAEAETNRSFALLGATLEASADGILVVDHQGKVVICNQKFADLWHIPQRILTSHNDSQILRFMLNQLEAPQVFTQTVKQLPIHADSFDRVKLKDGRTLECYSQPQRVDGICVGRVWSFRDITERLAAEMALRSSEIKSRKQAQRLEKALSTLKHTQAQLIQTEKMSSLGQLVAGIAHEINNPVNFISGNLAHADSYTENLLDLLNLYRQHYSDPIPEIKAKSEEIDVDFLAEDFLKLIASIKIGAERIQSIVRSLHHFSRTDETGFKPVDIHAGLDSTLMILQNRIKASPEHPEILIVKEYSALPAIECFASQLNQVFMNILVNAIDALEEEGQSRGKWSLVNGQPTWQNGQTKALSIRIQTILLDDCNIAIRIADNGRGIPKSLDAKLFDPFFTTKPVGKGTGLGLSISYQIITEKHGGKLYYISEEGQGTEFVIELPIQQDPDRV